MQFSQPLTIEPNREGKCPDGVFSAVVFPTLVVIVVPHPMGFRAHNFIATYNGIMNVDSFGERCRAVVMDNQVVEVQHGAIWVNGRDTGEVYR